MTPRLAIATVHPGTVDAQFAQCLAATLSEHPRSMELHGRGRVIFQHAPAGMIHAARNRAVGAFLKHPLGLTHLLFIDSDMTWQPDQVWQLFDCALTHDYPVLSGLYSMPDGKDGRESIPVMYDGNMRHVAPTEPIQRVYCAGLGFMLVRKNVYQQLLKKYFWPMPWFDYGVWDHKFISEDVFFSERMRTENIPIHVNTEIIIGHRKTFTYIHEPQVVAV